MTIDVRSELAVCSRELPLLAAHHRERANRCPLRIIPTRRASASTIEL